MTMTVGDAGFTSQDVAKIYDVKNSIQYFVKILKETEWFQDFVDANNIILTGGAIASLIQNEIPKDWDFYFTDWQAMRSFQEHLDTDYLKESIADVDEKYKEVVGKDGKMITANAVTMNSGASFITKIWGSPDDIRQSFDYVHCTPYYSLAVDKLYISKEQFDACSNKRLIVNNKESLKPYRLDKFLRRGYRK